MFQVIMQQRMLHVNTPWILAQGNCIKLEKPS